MYIIDVELKLIETYIKRLRSENYYFLTEMNQGCIQLSDMYNFIKCFQH